MQILRLVGFDMLDSEGDSLATRVGLSLVFVHALSNQSDDHKIHTPY